jgi:drug/metabolite transporter (DMT)-like permease
MLMVSGTLGFNQVAAKVALADIPPLMQAGLRSLVAAAILGVATRWRPPLRVTRDGTLGAGLVIGVFFALEFIALYLGLQWTSASHAILFLYTAPFFVALGLKSFVPAERLRPLQWGGLVLSFAGVGCALLASITISDAMLVGDLFCLLAGALWGVTTLLAKATRLRSAPPVEVLLYQLAVSAVVIPLAAVLKGERWPTAVSLLSTVAMGFQIAVACVTFLVWFWLLRRYRTGELSSMTFLTPLVGVAAGVLLLGDQLEPRFLFGLVLVAAGIFTVNWPERSVSSA